jgi:hypothetical protein
VWIKVGVCTAESIINIALCILGYLPGLLHAWYIILKYPDSEDPRYEPLEGDDVEGGRRVTYYYVSRQPNAPPQPERSYGATNTTPPHVSTGTRPAEGSSSNETGNGHPPTYAEAVKGDNKVQTQE